MKHLLFIVFILFSVLSGCKKNDGKDPVETGKPIKRSQGEPITGRQEVSAVIGAEGGTITSEDHSLLLVIPAGAVATPTTFSVQEITNTLEGSTAPSFKLLPEDVTFSKPITLSFSYANAEMENSNVELLQVAHQDKEGYYYVDKTRQINQDNKTISVSATHFSNWTVFEQFKLDGDRTTDAGGSVELTLKTYLLFDSGNGQTGIGAYIDDPNIDPVLEATEWALAGEGTLEREKNKCVYNAPANIPQQNPVVLSASITTHFYGSPDQMQKLILLHPIAIMGDEFLEVTIDEIIYYPSQATVTQQGNSIFISGVIGGNKMFSLRVNTSGPGTFPFRLPTVANAAEISLTDFEDPLDYYVSWRNACSENDPEFVYSGGNVKINKFPYQQGEIIEGSFSGASLFRGGNFCANQSIRIVSASFKIIRFQL